MTEVGLAGWFSEPGSAAALAAVAVLYVGGCRRVLRSGGRVGTFQPAMFALGWVTLVVALVSPLHPAGEVLVSAHMAQHTLLILAPLALVAGRTGTRLLQALAPTLRSQLVRHTRTWPRNWFPWWAALLAMMLTILVWHLPPVFQVATDIAVLHSLEHVSLVVVSFAYWANVVGAADRRRAEHGSALASIFILFVSGAAAGALMTFSAIPWYPGYLERTAAAGVDWLSDQQLAGVVMSVPMGVVLMGVGAWLAWRWSGAVGLAGPPRPAVSTGTTED